jgi:hypothetical protein
MSYNPAKMGVAAGTALVFITTFSSVFLSIWSLFFDYTATSTWLVPAISAFLFIIMFLILLEVMERVPGDLYTVMETLLGKVGAKLIAFYLFVVFYYEAALLIRQYGENTLLCPRLKTAPSLSIYNPDLPFGA